MNNTNGYRTNSYSKETYNQGSRDYKFINKQKRHRDDENTFKHSNYSNSNENHLSYKPQNNYQNKNYGKNTYSNEKYDKFSNFPNNKYHPKNRQDNRSHSRERKDYYSEKSRKGRNYQDDQSSNYERKNHRRESLSNEKHHSRDRLRSSSSRDYDEYHEQEYKQKSANTGNNADENDYKTGYLRKNGPLQSNFNETRNKDESRERQQSSEDFQGSKSYKNYGTSGNEIYQNNQPNQINSNGKYVENSSRIGAYEETSKDNIQSSIFPTSYPRVESKETIDQDDIIKKNNYNYEFSNNNSNNFSKNDNKLNNNYNNSNCSYEYSSKSTPTQKIPNAYNIQNTPAFPNTTNQAQIGFSNLGYENSQNIYQPNSKPYNNYNNSYAGGAGRKFSNENQNVNKLPIKDTLLYVPQENENPKPNIQNGGMMSNDGGVGKVTASGGYTQQFFNSNSIGNALGAQGGQIGQISQLTQLNQLVTHGQNLYPEQTTQVKLDTQVQASSMSLEANSKQDEESSKKMFNQFNQAQNPHNGQSGQYFNQIQKQGYYNNNIQSPNGIKYQTNAPINNLPNNQNYSQTNPNYYYSQVSNPSNSQTNIPNNQNQFNNKYYLNQSYQNHPNQQEYQQIYNNTNTNSLLQNGNQTNLTNQGINMNQGSLSNPLSKNIQVNISLNNQYNKDLTREVQKTINNNNIAQLPNGLYQNTNIPDYKNINNSVSGFSANMNMYQNPFMFNPNNSNNNLNTNNQYPSNNKELEINLPGYNDIRLDTNILSMLVITKSNENKKNFGKLIKESLNEYVIARENNKFSEFFKNLTMETSQESNEQSEKSKENIGDIEKIEEEKIEEYTTLINPCYYIDYVKTISQEELTIEKELKGIKSDLSNIKKKKENESTEIKKIKEVMLKIELSRLVLKAKQNEIRKTLDDILSETI